MWWGYMQKSQSKLLLICIVAYNIRHETNDYYHSHVFPRVDRYKNRLVCCGKERDSCKDCNYRTSSLGCKITKAYNIILKQ